MLIKTDKNFLTAIIPDNWDEVVYEFENYWECRCKRDDEVTSSNFFEKEKEFKQITDKIVLEFGNSLMEIYSTETCGVKFSVFLKKNKINERSSK